MSIFLSIGWIYLYYVTELYGLIFFELVLGYLSVVAFNTWDRYGNPDKDCFYAHVKCSMCGAYLLKHLKHLCPND